MFNMKIYGLTTKVNVHVVEKEEYNKKYMYIAGPDIEPGTPVALVSYITELPRLISWSI